MALYASVIRISLTYDRKTNDFQTILLNLAII